MRQTPTLQAVNVRMSLNPEVVGSIAIVRFWLQGDIQPPEIDVCLYEALAVKVVLVGVA